MSRHAGALGVNGRLGFEVIDDAACAPGPGGDRSPGIAGQRFLAGEGINNAVAKGDLIVLCQRPAVDDRQRIAAVDYYRSRPVGQALELQQHHGRNWLGGPGWQVKLYRKPKSPGMRRVERDFNE